ncbi:uncharacterized protein LOC141630039 [Silene latifolia]|uniref:uncharacterized protein LOC141630039 n=1 Tax=Silene latifolia TaxID=37657 RepID=UPI003D779BAF
MMGDQQNFFKEMLEESQRRDIVLQGIVTQGEELEIQIAQIKETQLTTPHHSLDIDHECEFEGVTFDEKWEEPTSLSSCEYESVVFDEKDMKLSKPNTLNLCEYEGVSFDVNVEMVEEELMKRSEAPIYDLYGDSDDDKPMEEAYAGYVSCNEEEEWSCEISLLEEPILEKFEVCFHEEDEFLFPISHEDYLAPTMEPMIVGEDMVDLLQKVKASYKSYLVAKLKEKLAREATCGNLAPTMSTSKVSSHQCYENSPSTLEGLKNSNAIIITKIEREGGKWKSPDEYKPHFIPYVDKNHGLVGLKHCKRSSAKGKVKKRISDKLPWPSFILNWNKPYSCLFEDCAQAFDRLLRALSNMDKINNHGNKE